MRRLAMSFLLSTPALAQEAAPPAPAAPAPEPRDRRYTLVEEFTAESLEAGEIKIGTDLEAGLGGGVMIGTDVIALAVGATTLQGKVKVWESGEHRVALGVRAAYLSKKTLLWGSVNEHFDELDARIVRPSVAWTNVLSPRLKLHTFWAKGFGKIRAKLSEKGRRKLWETKHPGADYEQRDETTQEPKAAPSPDETPDDGTDEPAPSTTSNQEKDAEAKKSALTSQSVQVQSITGLAQERFQLTGEFDRAGGNKVLVTSRIEQTEFEKLKSNFFRLTVAHQWIWSTFQMRLGVGAQYYVLSGYDLDDEKIDEAGMQPASDIGFYWRF